jgi:hypothetical protein
MFLFTDVCVCVLFFPAHRRSLPSPKTLKNDLEKRSFEKTGCRPVYSATGRNMNCQFHLPGPVNSLDRVHHGLRPRGYDRSLALCVNDQAAMTDHPRPPVNLVTGGGP